MTTTLTARRAGALAVLALLSVSAFAAGPLFPQPLHLTRAVEDPDGSTTMVDEYCRGNTVISISGSRTVIADYEKQTVTEIDRAAGTYSVTSFADLARLAPPPPMTAKNPDEAFTFRAGGPRAAHAGAEYVEADAKVASSHIRKVETGVDRTVTLSRDAAEVLAGAAYPRPRSEESEIALRAAAPAAGARRAATNSAGSAPAQSYGLPVDTSVTYDLGGRTVVVRNHITRVSNEEPLASLIAIPPGARLVESAAVQAQKALDEADHLPGAATPTRAHP